MTTDNSANLTDQLTQLKQEYLAQLPSQVNAIVELYNQLNYSVDVIERHQKIEALLFSLHKIKGSSGTFGLTHINVAAINLEQQLRLLDANASVDQSQIIKLLRQEMLKFRHAVPAQLQTEKGGVALKTITSKVNNRADGPIELLLIEDHLFYGEQLSGNLREFGFVVNWKKSLQESKDAYSKNKPHLIISDLNLPDAAPRDVFEFLQEASAQQVPFIVLSSSGGFSNRLQALRSGAACYFTKPVIFNTLISKLKEVLDIEKEPTYRVLMCDDQRSITSYYKELLRQHGIELTGVSDPESLLTELERTEPDLFLLAYHMKGYTGDEIASIIRQLQEYEATPILFLTAESVDRLKATLVESGSDDVICKTTDQQILIRQIKSRIRRGRRLRMQMKTDSLTQLFNHGYILELAAQFFKMTERSKQPCVLVMVDIDHFKVVNDSYGHVAGDRVISSLSHLMKQRLRGSDAIGRYGGEEFLVLMPNTTKSEALVVIQKLLKTFSQIRFLEHGKEFNCTFSAGICEFGETSSADNAVELADKRLYMAKTQGRNKVIA